MAPSRPRNQEKPKFEKKKENNNKPSTSNNATVKSSPSKEGEKKTRTCGFCDQVNHRASSCPTIKDLPPRARSKLAREKHLCLNCLGRASGKHTAESCRSPACSTDNCAKKHHVLLHFGPTQASSNATTVESNPPA